MPYIDRRSTTTHTASAVVSDNYAVHFVNGGSALTMTLVAPDPSTVGMSLVLISKSAFAHIVTLSGGFGADANQTTFTMEAKVGAMINLVSDGVSWYTVDTRYGTFAGDVQSYAASGAIDPLFQNNLLTKAGVGVMTLADPVPNQNGQIISIFSTTAQAHTVTYTGGFGDAGTGADVATYGGAKGDGLTAVAISSIWYLMSLRGVTVA